MSLLKVENLFCGYGKKKVIEDISFNILPGEISGIIGPNGAGKTTLFRAITRILDTSSGQIKYRGRNIKDMTIRELARLIGVLPQSMPAAFSFTVLDFVLMGRSPHMKRWQSIQEEDLALADEMMRLTEVKDLKNRYITELSGGELQRVLLAQALVQEPELLLLDEPTSHLDITHQVEIMDLIRKLNKEKKLTIIMVLHDLNLAGEYCDRLILLDKGKIHTIGSPNEVLTYSNIEKVYRTVVVVKDNPITKRPHVLLIPKEKWK